MTDRVRLGTCSEGYTVIHGPDGERVRVHRLVALGHYDPARVAAADIHHLNGLKWDNSPENLIPRNPWDHRRANLLNHSSGGEEVDG